MHDLFARSRLLIGEEGLRRLAEARILVVGLGAVGSYVVEGLARAGVGMLRLVDDDVIRASNRNRQLYALEGTAGQPKAWLARDRVAAIHPGCRVDARAVRACEGSVEALLEGGFHAIVDAIDTVGDKVDLMAAATDGAIPIRVSILGAATRMDPLAMRIADLARTSHCPLARAFRRGMAARGIRSGVTCIYSIEAPRNGGMRPSVDEEADEESRKGLRPMGSMPCMPGIFGLSGAQAVLNALLASLQD